MKVDTSIPHHFLSKPYAALVRAAIVFLTAAFAVWIVFFDGFEGTRKELLLELICGGVLVLVPFYIVGLWRAVKNHSRPLIEVSDDGLFDRRIMHSPLPWDAVTGISDIPKGNALTRKKFLEVKLKEKALLRSRQHIDQKFLHVIGFPGKPILQLNTLALKSSLETLKAVVDAFWNKHNSNDARSLTSSTVN